MSKTKLRWPFGPRATHRMDLKALKRGIFEDKNNFVDQEAMRKKRMDIFRTALENNTKYPAF